MPKFLKYWLTPSFMNVTHCHEIFSRGMHLPDGFKFAHVTGPWHEEYVETFCSMEWIS